MCISLKLWEVDVLDLVSGLWLLTSSQKMVNLQTYYTELSTVSPLVLSEILHWYPL